MGELSMGLYANPSSKNRMAEHANSQEGTSDIFSEIRCKTLPIPPSDKSPTRIDRIEGNFKRFRVGLAQRGKVENVNG